ncbi:MAG TPA: hypothetical protein VGI57_14830, partial [Usitatibacter sp.]
QRATVLACLHVGADEPELGVGGMGHRARAVEGQLSPRRIEARERRLTLGDEFAAGRRRFIRCRAGCGYEQRGEDRRRQAIKDSYWLRQGTSCPPPG